MNLDLFRVTLKCNSVDKDGPVGNENVALLGREVAAPRLSLPGRLKGGSL